VGFAERRRTSWCPGSTARFGPAASCTGRARRAPCCSTSRGSRRAQPYGAPGEPGHNTALAFFVGSRGYAARWGADVVHLNDWQTGLAPLRSRTAGKVPACSWSTTCHTRGTSRPRSVADRIPGSFYRAENGLEFTAGVIARAELPGRPLGYGILDLCPRDPDPGIRGRLDGRCGSVVARCMASRTVSTPRSSPPTPAWLPRTTPIISPERMRTGLPCGRLASRRRVSVARVTGSPPEGRACV
jgi:hypothetical protein